MWMCCLLHGHLCQFVSHSEDDLQSFLVVISNQRVLLACLSVFKIQFTYKCSDYSQLWIFVVMFKTGEYYFCILYECIYLHLFVHALMITFIMCH